jgi:hypothetical protein
MGAWVATATLQGAMEGAITWSKFFAREPEPDLELEDVGTGQDDAALGSQEPQPRRPKSRIPMLILLGVVLLGGAYVAMNPDVVQPLLGSLMGGTEEAPPPQPPPAPVAKKTPVFPPAPATPPSAMEPPPGMPSDSSPASPEMSARPGAPTAAVTPSSPAAPPAEIPSSAKSPSSIPIPSFGEGQRVTVKQDPDSPAGVGLTLDAAGSRPGPLLRTGATVTVLDAELQNNRWIYSVKTDDGTRGWVAESHLSK